MIFYWFFILGLYIIFYNFVLYSIYETSKLPVYSSILFRFIMDETFDETFNQKKNG